MGWVWARCSLCRSHTVTGLESCPLPPLPKEIGAQLQAVCLGLEFPGGDGLMVEIGYPSGLSQPYRFYEQIKDILLSYTLSKILKSKKKPKAKFININ